MEQHKKTGVKMDKKRWQIQSALTFGLSVLFLVLAIISGESRGVFPFMSFMAVVTCFITVSFGLIARRDIESQQQKKNRTTSNKLTEQQQKQNKTKHSNIMATKFTLNTITKRFSTQSDFVSHLAKMEVRVSPYGLEKFPLASLGKVEQVQQKQNSAGWEITPFDKTISKSLRRELETYTEKMGMRVFFDTKRETLKVVPKKDSITKKVKGPPSIDFLCDGDGFIVEDIDDDSLYNKRHQRLSKAFKMVDSKHMRKKNQKTSSFNLKVKQIQQLASELDVSNQVSQRIGRIALKNKKAMRQMLKRLTAQDTDSMELSFSK